MSEDKTYSQIREDFYNKYANIFVPLCKKKFETERIWRLILASVIALLGSFLIGCYIVIAYKTKEFDVNALVILIGGICSLILALKKNFEQKIKIKIMPHFCKCFGDFYWHNGRSKDNTSYKQPKALYTKVGLVGTYNKEYYDDTFQGSFKNVKINIRECKLKLVKRSGKNKSTQTIFEGVVVQLDMNKSFKCHTVIAPNSLFHFSGLSELRHTKMEDVVFEKKYDVYTNDEVEARVLISPAFMERLNNLKTVFKVRKISCSFYQDKLFIAMHTRRDLFSIGSLICPVYKGRQWVNMLEEFLSIIKLIDYFKLNERLLL